LSRLVSTGEEGVKKKSDQPSTRFLEKPGTSGNRDVNFQRILKLIQVSCVHELEELINRQIIRDQKPSG
jgi:hypothetical protein